MAFWRSYSRRARVQSLCFALIPCCLFFSSPLLAQSANDQTKVSTPSAEELLTQLAHAVRSGNYSGRLTYEHSGKLEVMEIAHGVMDGIEYERVTYLNGPPRGIVKSGRESECATLGSHLFAGGKVAIGDHFLSLENAYHFRVLGNERVAGRPTWILQLQPKDELRHGLIIAVDHETSLPVKSLFISPAGKVLERLHFVSLDASPEFNQDYFTATDDFAHVSDDCPPNEAPQSEAQWRPAWLPEGFVLSHYQFSKEDGHMETYTDGLSSFSVFTKTIEIDKHLTSKQADDQTSVSAKQNEKTGAKKGATLVIMKTIESQTPKMHVSVIGEIPKLTANRVLASVEVREAK